MKTFLHKYRAALLPLATAAAMLFTFFSVSAHGSFDARIDPAAPLQRAVVFENSGAPLPLSDTRLNVSTEAECSALFGLAQPRTSLRKVARDFPGNETIHVVRPFSIKLESESPEYVYYTWFEGTLEMEYVVNRYFGVILSASDVKLGPLCTLAPYGPAGTPIIKDLRSLEPIYNEQAQTVTFQFTIQLAHMDDTGTKTWCSYPRATITATYGL